MASLACYIVAAIFFLFAAIEQPITNHPVEFGMFFVALGLALSSVTWPRRLP